RIRARHRGLPVRQVIAFDAGGRSPVTRAEIFQEFHAWTLCRTQRRDVKPRAEDVVQPFLFGSVVRAFASDPKAQSIPIEAEALAGVGDDDRRVVDAEEQPVGGRMPFRIALSRREMQNLEGVPVGVFEVERFDSSGRRIPIGETLWLWRRVLDTMLPQS